MWFITKIEKLELDAWYNIDIGSKEVCGYFSSKEQAIEVLKKEEQISYDGILYDYAVLEKFEEGLYPCAQEEIWFKYDESRKGYFEIKTPDCMNDYSSWGIG